MKNLELQEKDLQLVVTDKQLGNLTTNANQIKEFVKKVLPQYSVDNYSENNIDQAKKDKALLNNAKKILNSKRIELEKEFQKPFEEFKSIISETCNLIADCVSKIDSVVKESEQREKDEKRREISEYFVSKNFSLIPFAKIFDEKWLNKSISMKSVKSEIDEKIQTIQNDVETLKTFGEDAELIQSIYLENLNLSNAIQYGNRLKENKTKIQEQEKPQEKAPEPVPTQKTAPKQEESKNSPEILVRAFKVKATKEKIIALSEFMNQNKIEFEKINL